MWCLSATPRERRQRRRRGCSGRRDRQVCVCPTGDARCQLVGWRQIVLECKECTRDRVRTGRGRTSAFPALLSPRSQRSRSIFRAGEPRSSPASASLPAAEGGGEGSAVVSWGSSLWFWVFAALVSRTVNLGVSVAQGY